MVDPRANYKTKNKIKSWLLLYECIVFPMFNLWNIFVEVTT